jgi:hypothetical protein
MTDNEIVEGVPQAIGTDMLTLGTDWFGGYRSVVD